MNSDVTRPGKLLLSGIALMLLPKCPACWPLYAAALSALGLDFLFESSIVMALVAAILALSLYILGRQARATREFRPLAVALIGVLTLSIGVFTTESRLAHYAGIALLTISTIWNVRLARPEKQCCCATAR